MELLLSLLLSLLGTVAAVGGGGCLVVTLFVWAAVVAWRRRQARAEAYEGPGADLARALGLQPDGPLGMEGTRRGRRVRIARHPDGTLEARVLTGAPQVGLRQSSVGSTPVGDPGFDEAWAFSGHPIQLASMSRRVRQAYASLLTAQPASGPRGVAVRGLPADSDAAALEAWLDRLTEVADALEEAAAHPEQVAADRSEPRPVRAAAAEQLSEAQHADELRALLTDPDPDLAAIAALTLRDPDGLFAAVVAPELSHEPWVRVRRVLPQRMAPRAIEQLVATDTSTSWARAASLAAVVPSEAASEALLTMFGPDGVDLDTFHINSAGRSRFARATVRAFVLAPVPGAVAVALRLARCGAPRPLIEESVRIASLHGTGDDLPLLRATQAVLDDRYHDVLDKVAERIKARSDVRPGRLAIVEPAPQAGALAVAESPGAGALSEAERARLSRPTVPEG